MPSRNPFNYFQGLIHFISSLQLPEQYRTLNTTPARKHKNKHKKHKHKEGGLPQEPSLGKNLQTKFTIAKYLIFLTISHFHVDPSGLDTHEKKHKKQKRHEDDKERKKRKKEKKRKRQRHSPEHPGSGGGGIMLPQQQTQLF